MGRCIDMRARTEASRRCLNSRKKPRGARVRRSTLIIAKLWTQTSCFSDACARITRSWTSRRTPTIPSRRERKRTPIRKLTDAVGNAIGIASDGRARERRCERSSQFIRPQWDGRPTDRRRDRQGRRDDGEELAWTSDITRDSLGRHYEEEFADEHRRRYWTITSKCVG